MITDFHGTYRARVSLGGYPERVPLSEELTLKDFARDFAEIFLVRLAQQPEFRHGPRAQTHGHLFEFHCHEKGLVRKARQAWRCCRHSGDRGAGTPNRPRGKAARR